LTGLMASKLLKMCEANYPSYGDNSNEGKGILWMKEFANRKDDLMETAILSCMSYCKKFPTIADINEAIKDLQYDEKTKPSKQITYDRKWYEPLAFKAFELVGKQKDCKKYLADVDVKPLMEYAKSIFPGISDELVLKNYPEFAQGLQSLEACLYCRMDKSQCVTAGYSIKHVLTPDGWIKNEYARCKKNPEQPKKRGRE